MCYYTWEPHGSTSSACCKRAVECTRLAVARYWYHVLFGSSTTSSDCVLYYGVCFEEADSPASKASCSVFWLHVCANRLGKVLLYATAADIYGYVASGLVVIASLSCQ
jgi:hypothetical protein